MRKHDEPRQRRFQMHAILIAVTLMLVAGRIATVLNTEGDAAFLSANDRSRWVTVAALVEKNTWAIDELITIKTDRGHRLWDTIDKVRHVGPDGRLHYYSSKPTLLTSMIAGVYWTLNAVTGLKMTDHPIYVPRLLLLLINLPVLALFLITTTMVIEWSRVTDFAKRLAVIATCFATFATPFAISLNNHLFAVAATSLTLAIYLGMSNKVHDSFASSTFHPKFWTFALAGTSAAFAVACELPSLSMFALWAVLFTMLFRNSIPGFVLGAVVVGIGIFGTNYWAHQTWKTPYAHRGVGEVAEEFQWDTGDAPANESRINESRINESLSQQLASLDRFARAESITVRPLESGGFEAIAEFPNEFSLDAPAKQQIWKVQPKTVSATKNAWQLAVWDDWYDYPRSYWRTGQRWGVDQGQPSRGVYAFHATLGYYGIFSLTPLWLLMPLGLVYKCTQGPSDRRYLAGAIALATVVCFLFYIARPEIDRNYGGVSVCFRWMLWFTPLWIYAILPELNELSETRIGRWFAIALVTLSVFSVSTSLDSPWQSPWMYRFASFLGWLG